MLAPSLYPVVITGCSRLWDDGEVGSGSGLREAKGREVKSRQQKTRLGGFFQFLQKDFPVDEKASWLELQTNYVGSSRAFLALLDGELNALTFVQGFEAGGLDSGEVYEHVFATVSRGDEAKTFLSVEELYGTSHFVRHNNFLE